MDKVLPELDWKFWVCREFLRGCVRDFRRNWLMKFSTGNLVSQCRWTKFGELWLFCLRMPGWAHYGEHRISGRHRKTVSTTKIKRTLLHMTVWRGNKKVESLLWCLNFRKTMILEWLVRKYRLLAFSRDWIEAWYEEMQGNNKNGPEDIDSTTKVPQNYRWSSERRQSWRSWLVKFGRS